MPANYVHLWCITSDAGPDQVASRSYLKTLLTQPLYAKQLMFDVSCWKHQFHLLCKDGLHQVDLLLKASGRPWRYFSSIAKMCHTWRAHGFKIGRVWRETFKDAYKNKSAKYLPPVPIAGRWASVASACG